MTHGPTIAVQATSTALACELTAASSAARRSPYLRSLEERLGRSFRQNTRTLYRCVALMRRPAEWRPAWRSIRVTPLYVLVFLQAGPALRRRAGAGSGY